MFTLAELLSVLPIVRAAVPPTPQYAWPLLRSRVGAQVVVKHENHTPIGAFKVRGGLVYFDRLKRERPHVAGVITATRGNHDQSFAFAGAQANVPVAIVVPRGNSTEKNAAMRAFGAELIEHGRDFDEAKARAIELAQARGFEFGPSFHRDLVVGVATYAYELFSAYTDLDTVYVPIGLGSGICGLIGVRDALGLTTPTIRVVSPSAPTPTGSRSKRAASYRRIPRSPSRTGLRCARPMRRRSRSFEGEPSASSKSRTRRSPRRSASCSAIRIRSPKAPAPRPWRR